MRYKAVVRGVAVPLLAAALVGGGLSQPAHAEGEVTPTTYSVFTDASCQPTNGRKSVTGFVTGGVDPEDDGPAVTQVYVTPERVSDHLVAPDSVATNIQEGEERYIPLWVTPAGSGLPAGTWQLIYYADAEHTQWLATTPTFYVEQCSVNEPPPPGDDPPPVPGGGGVVRPPDATGDLQVLPKRQGKKGFKVRMSWDGTGIDHESRFKVMIQPPNLKTPIPVFTIAAGEVGSKLLSHRQLKPKKLMPKGTRIKYWVEHLRIDNGELIWVCVDEVIVGKRKSGCRS